MCVYIVGMASNVCELTATRHLLADDGLERRVRGLLHAHKAFVERLGYVCQLEGHTGCVNCLEWNDEGSLLVSGSDDVDVHVWNPFERRSVACVHTGHTGNIFSVKFLPSSKDRLLLSGAEDREVRLHDLSTFQTLQVWSCCGGRVKRLAVSPHTPHLCWSASEDGCIRQFDTRERHSCSSEGRCRNVLVDLRQTCGAIQSSTQCKCLDVNPVRSEQVAVGALDAYVRVYDRRLLTLGMPCTELSSRPEPSCLAHFAPGHVSQAHHRSHRHPSSLSCTYLCFSPCGSELLVNMSGEHVYLYRTLFLDRPLKYSTVQGTEPVLVQGPAPFITSPSQSVSRIKQGQCELQLSHEESVAEDSIPSLIREMKDLGNMFYNQKQFTEAIQQYSAALNIFPNWSLLYSNRATAYLRRGWCGDVYQALGDSERALQLSPTHIKSLRRRIKCLWTLGWETEAKAFLQRYREGYSDHSDFLSRYDKELDSKPSEGRNGFLSSEHRHISEWEKSRQKTACDYQQRFCGHCNTHTDIKEASFLGERGEYVAAGSDDGNMFIWERTTGNLVRVLRADESIINCIQWNPRTALLATSGIEASVKLWEPSPPKDPGFERVMPDMFKISQTNQSRMKMDPFEIMLMRMGLRPVEDEHGDEHLCRQS